MRKKVNYDNIPISEETRKGMSLNIDDLGAIGRMLNLQDDAYDDQFETFNKKIDRLFALMDTQNIAIQTILETLKVLKQSVDEQNKIIKKIQGLISTIQDELRDHDVRIKKLEGRMQKLLLEHEHNHD